MPYTFLALSRSDNPQNLSLSASKIYVLNRYEMSIRDKLNSLYVYLILKVNAMADCEIYLQNPDMETMMTWVEARVGDMDWISENKDMVVFHAQASGDTLPIIIQKNIEDTDFIGIWFNSVHAPWDTDADCARDAFLALNCTLQCDPGETIKGKNKFLQIDINGENLIEI